MKLAETIERVRTLKLEHIQPAQRAWTDRRTDDQDMRTIEHMLTGTGVSWDEVEDYVRRVIATVERDRRRGGMLRGAKASEVRALTQSCVIEGLLVGLHHTAAGDR